MFTGPAGPPPAEGLDLCGQDRHVSRRNGSTEASELVGKVLRDGPRHEEHGLPDPYHAGSADVRHGPALGRVGSAEDEMGDARGDGAAIDGHIVRQEDHRGWIHAGS
jgi:hypothetical protein